MGIEPHHPVTDNLEPDADLHRFALPRAIIDRRERQQPSCLRAFVRFAIARKAVASKSSRSPIAAAMANLPVFAMMNQISDDSGILQ
jgi:hypothetical protein